MLCYKTLHPPQKQCECESECELATLFIMSVPSIKPHSPTRSDFVGGINKQIPVKTGIMLRHRIWR